MAGAFPGSLLGGALAVALPSWVLSVAMIGTTSLPLTAFIVVYMIASPIFGSLADRVPRKVLIAVGVGLWSLATASAALATGFWSLLAARAMVGVGEAAYATLAPVLLADFFPEERRNRILTYFYVAIP